MITLARKFTKQASEALIVVGTFGLLLMTAIIGWQVFGRYVLGASPNWSEQAAVTLMIWYISFAAAAGVREGFHIRIQAIESFVSVKMVFALRRFSEFVVGAIGLCMAVYGVKLCIATWHFDIPSLGFSRGMGFLAIPISGALIAIFSIERLLEAAFSNEVSEEEKA